MASPGRRVLYISYDGILEPLGESQVVTYIERLAARAAITLLSFEKPADLASAERRDAMRRRLERAGITWVARRYHKKPPVLSTVADVLTGCVAARAWATHGRPGIVHARGYVPSLIALHAKRMYGARFIFDMRGFWVDEKVDAGHWVRGGWLHLVGKWCERTFLEGADAIVSLTHAAVEELPALGRVRADVPVEVIPTCADLARFHPALDRADREDVARRRRDLGLEGALVVGCVGTLSNWYLREQTLRYVAWVTRRAEHVKVLFVTREDHVALRADAIRFGIPEDRLTLMSAPFDEMPAWMRVMDVGVFFIRVCFSKRASAATKLAEFLGSGVPVVINDGIGDSGVLVREGRVGVVLPVAAPDAFDATDRELRRLLADPATAAHCRALAAREFSVDHGVSRYGWLYDHLSE